VNTLSSLAGIGPQIAQRLEKLGLRTVEDLLWHLPLRYQDRTAIQLISTLKPGEEAVIEAVVEASEIKNGKKRMLLCLLRDDSGPLMLRFFHFTPAQQKQFVPGTVLRCYGEVREGYDCLEMTHPDYRRIDPEHPAPLQETLTPIYPTTEGLNQNLLRKFTEQALNRSVADYLPVSLRRHFHLPELAEALHTVHRPPPEVDVAALQAGLHPAQQRLAFEELLAHHLSLRLLRSQAQTRAAPVLGGSGELRRCLLQALPFSLTPAQVRAWHEIEADLARPTPMQRLLQGDVGSGKTVVAALAAAQAVESGYQVAVMAPTELLAEQHLRTFGPWLEPLGLTPLWLAGSLGKKQREPVLAALADGSAKIAVGTHALFQEGVNFARLGLIIIDEQHRFGVHQRLALRDKGAADGLHPHQLIMTATPIPRTLAMTAYADLDVSVIDELPPGRTPITTVIIPNTRRAELVARVAAACHEGKQAYWVCPLIEESEVLECQAAENAAANLSQDLPDVRVGLVHGRMKAADKDRIMAEFKVGEIQLLVATTVIEVGVDVPNASLMIIENAERMGLAQLHQLRGRVGRGAVQSFCVLLYQSPLSESGKTRLATVRDTQDGFIISQKDLELRGPGEVLGTRQTGLAQMRIADLRRDQDLLARIAEAGEILLRDAPQAAPLLIERWVREGWAYGEVG
jgi:ATP-dependent DNA helicase RecG